MKRKTKNTKGKSCCW